MGVDYSWFRTREPESQLRPLCERQALAAQSMRACRLFERSDVDETGREVLDSLHEESYRVASGELRSRLHMPDWDEEALAATEMPDLHPCFRVYAITYNPTFPPLWRIQGYRTILPTELPGQIEEWRTWSTEVAAGQHDGYLRWLHLHHDSNWLQYHWTILRENARHSLDEAARTEEVSEFIDIREQILRLPKPWVTAAPILPSASREEFPEAQNEKTRALIETVCRHTQTWNRYAEARWKVGYGPQCYFASLDTFRAGASDEWLAEFLGWASRCAAEGFGLFLDY